MGDDIPPVELSDRDVARILGRQSVARLMLIATEQGMYERVDGTWYRLSDQPIQVSGEPVDGP
jgi:hypothetical protein